MSIYSSSFQKEILNNPNTSLYKICKLISNKSKSVLDVGCSSGYLGQHIKSSLKNISVDGIEIDKKDRNLAKKYLNNVYNLNIEKTKEINKIIKKYDVIIFADVLEHTSKPKEILNELSKKLNPNGQILLSIPNITHQSVILELLSGQWNYENSGILDKTHLHFFDYNEAIKLLEDNNLFINKIDYSIFDLPKQKIVEILNIQGINSTNELIRLLKRSQHKVFQYIISATNYKIPKYKSYINNKEIIKPIENWINDWEIFMKKNENIKIIENELEEIKKSKLYKLWPLYNKIKQILKK
jgi:2-polyprenyl-3-methyl-5-hydroxy-6-metoxy-1,4-benzoquinol methylase